MKEMIIPDVRKNKEKGIIEKLKDLKNQIRFYESDESGGTELILPGFMQRVISECKEIVDELSETTMRESLGLGDDNKIRTSKEQITRISEIIKEKYNSNSSTKSIVDILGGNKNYLTISVISYLDYMSSGIVSSIEEKKRMKAIDSNYKKVYFDKSKPKYNKEIFWSMLGALIASAKVLDGIKDLDNINSMTLVKKK